MTAPPTPSQTVGPYFALGLCVAPQNRAVAPDAPGAMTLRGRVLDGAGEPVPDALIELWQAEPPAWARCPTDAAGRWEVVVPRPAAGHADLAIFARGLLRHLVARVHLDPAALAGPLARLSEDERATLVARPEGGAFRFDIRLQGDGATAFLAV